MSSPRHIAIPLTLAVALALGACGSSDDKSSSASTTTPPTTAPAAATTPAAPAGAGGTVKLAADSSGALSFDATTLAAKAGAVTIDLSNPSPVPHAIAVKDNGVDEQGQTVSTGGHSTVTVDLKPGTYTFYCPVPGHEAGGMKGTLKVS